MKKRIMYILIAAIIAFNVVSVYASTEADSLVTTQQQESLSERIKGYILSKYGELYSFDNFSFEFADQRIEGNNTLIDVEVSELDGSDIAAQM